MSAAAASPRLTVGVTGMNAQPESPGPGLAVARCLREAFGPRIRLIGFGYDALDPGLYVDGVCDAGYMLPYPGSGSDAMLERLEEIQAEERMDAFIPCLDSELPLLIDRVAELNALGLRTFLPDAAQFALRSKERLPELALRAGVASPELKTLTQADFFATCEEQGWSFPLVIKGPLYDARVVHNPADARAAFHAIAAQWGLPVIVQRHISGEEYNLTAVGDGRGRLLGEVMMKKRALTARGKAWAGVTTNDAALAQTAARLAEILRWRGPLEVELMRDAGGRYHLIEINPRFPAWVYLSHGVGRNLPHLLVSLILGEAPPVLEPVKAGTLFIRHALETIVSLDQFQSMMMDGRTAAGSSARSDVDSGAKLKQVGR